MRDFWHVQGRMELLEMLQKDAKCEEDAIKEFYDFYTEVCQRYPKFYLISDNPVMDLGFLNLSIATKLGKPPLTYRPLPRSPAPLPKDAPEAESDEEPSTEDVADEDDDESENFGESGEEDCEVDEQTNGVSAVPRLHTEVIKSSGDHQTISAESKELAAKAPLASFYDNYSAPHFAVDLNSFACGLIGLHLPPFRKASGSRWASPTDFLSFHKPYLICPYRKTHDPVDDASFNCWQFLQCISILWMNEYSDMYNVRKEQNYHAYNTIPTKVEKESKAVSNSNLDAEFPTITSANNKEKKASRTPRRGRNASVTAVTQVSGKDKPSSPVSHSKQKQSSSYQSPRKPQSQGKSKSVTSGINNGSNANTGNNGAGRTYRRNVRSNSDPVPPSAATIMSASCAVIANSKVNAASHAGRTDADGDAVKVLF